MNIFVKETSTFTTPQCLDYPLIEALIHCKRSGNLVIVLKAQSF